MISALPPKIASTTAGVGMIGVKPAKTTKVATASSKAAPTANGPNRPAVRPLNSKRSARCPRLFDGLRCSHRRRNSFSCAMSSITHQELQQCNDVARLRQNGGGLARQSRAKHRRSAQAADGPQIEIADFLAQGVAVEAEHLGRLDLVAAGRRQRRGDQRRLQFAQQAMIEPDRRQVVAERPEQFGDMPLDPG